MDIMSITELVLDELVKATGNDEVRHNLDLALFDEGLLDSLATVELVVAFGDTLQINLTPAQIDRRMWATPRKIIADLEVRTRN